MRCKANREAPAIGASRFLRGGKAQPVKYLKTIGETAKTGFFVPLLIAEMVYNRNNTGKARFYRPSLLTLCAETALQGNGRAFIRAKALWRKERSN